MKQQHLMSRGNYFGIVSPCWVDTEKPYLIRNLYTLQKTKPCMVKKKDSVIATHKEDKINVMCSAIIIIVL